MSGPVQEKEISLARAKCRGLFVAALFFSVFTNLLMLTGPLFMLQVYDRVLGSRSEETLVALSVLVALLYLFYGLLEFARGRVMARVGARFQALLNRRVFNAFLEYSALARNSDKAMSAPSDLEAIRTFFASPVLLAMFDAPWTPVFLAAIFIFHPLLGWMAIAGGGLLIVASITNQIVTRKKVLDAQRYSSAAQRFARQVEGSSPYLWAQGMGQVMAERWEHLENGSVDRSTRASDLTGSFTTFAKAFRLFLQSAMLALGAWLVLQNELTAGAMIAGSIMLGRALAPIEQGLPQWPVVQRAAAAWRRLSDLLQMVPKRDEPLELPEPEARLDVNAITVISQPGNPPILTQVSFGLAPGEVVGIIGKSGSGKTTLARTLVGLLRPNAGEIRFAGATLLQYGQQRLGRYFGYLPQEVVLFDGTVAENIAQMALEPDSDKVVTAARRARVHDVILKLPKGYDTQVGSADMQLSGGQKQRLALARALYHDPVLLVLDEPNSALDAEGSEALNTAVSEMKSAGKAVLIMTHRPTAISTCDRLLVLDGGKVAAYGPRDEIIKSMMRNAGDVSRAVQGGGRA